MISYYICLCLTSHGPWSGPSHGPDNTGPSVLLQMHDFFLWLHIIPLYMCVCMRIIVIHLSLDDI